MYAGEFRARLAQSVEHQTFNLRVAGSSPSSGAKYLITPYDAATIIMGDAERRMHCAQLLASDAC